MDEPVGFDWLWLPLEKSIGEMLKSWAVEHYRLRRDVSFQLELRLEVNLLDGHLAFPSHGEGDHADLHVGGIDPVGEIALHFQGGPTWLPLPLDPNDLLSDLKKIAAMVRENEIQVGLVLVFDEMEAQDSIRNKNVAAAKASGYGEVDCLVRQRPKYEETTKKEALALGFRCSQLASSEVVCWVWWISNNA